jgi:hypothetical protein
MKTEKEIADEDAAIAEILAPYELKNVINSEDFSIINKLEKEFLDEFSKNHPKLINFERDIFHFPKENRCELWFNRSSGLKLTYEFIKDIWNIHHTNSFDELTYATTEELLNTYKEDEL